MLVEGGEKLSLDTNLFFAKLEINRYVVYDLQLKLSSIPLPIPLYIFNNPCTVLKYFQKPNKLLKQVVVLNILDSCLYSPFMRLSNTMVNQLLQMLGQVYVVKHGLLTFIKVLGFLSQMDRSFVFSIQVGYYEYIGSFKARFRSW
eukprot:TRINITY_DN3822_c1_g1_i1.p3 TRINITY_DN3822_c1_g1~~TRINITY_DN3822_c1_g1_i1.p3  ORF type:complete len:145 (-),score=6.62 TRINITY_DN3822_c1_g1_i1:542-976(-)